MRVRPKVRFALQVASLSSSLRWRLSRVSSQLSHFTSEVCYRRAFWNTVRLRIAVSVRATLLHFAAGVRYLLAFRNTVRLRIGVLVLGPPRLLLN